MVVVITTRLTGWVGSDVVRSAIGVVSFGGFRLITATTAVLDNGGSRAAADGG